MTRKSWKYVLASGIAAILATLGIARLVQNSAALADERSPANAATSESAERSSSAAASEEKLRTDPAASQIRPGDWNQWAGSPIRNNIPEGKNIATEWRPGQFDEDTGAWNRQTSKNIKWVARLGTKSNGNAVVANGKIFMGTNNGGGHLKRYPSSVDLGVLLCFNEADGKFLWQDSSEKLPTGRVNDWPYEGICSVPLLEGHRLWYVTSRGEVKCLDTDERKPGTT